MPLNEQWGDYVPPTAKDGLPPRRRPVMKRIATALLVAFELAMLVYFLATPSRHRPSDLIGIWVLGSMILLAFLGFAMGETTHDMADLGGGGGR